MSIFPATPGGVPPLATNITTILALFTLAGEIRPFPNCNVEPLKSIGICNSSASNLDRSTSLVSLFSTEEKLSFMGSYIPETKRLGIPPYTLFNEALHGIVAGNSGSPGVNRSDSGDFSSATSFPQPILTAAAFDDTLVEDIATAISIEGRAFGNAGRAGLNFWTPNINPFCDPRWGRGKETPGEDPFRVSGYTKAFITAFEKPSPNSTFKRAVANCKHFAAYDLENYANVTRFEFDAVVTVQELAEYYVPSFKTCTRDADVGSIMCSYNSINGTPACLDPWLLQTLLREHWGWEADNHYVSSDCAAIDVAFTAHNYTLTPEETAAIALKAGTDSDCGIYYPTYLPTALSKGLISEKDLDRALIRVFATLITLGYYDPPESQPYRSIGPSAINTPATQKLARKAATSGMTLLKNRNNFLPLSVPTGKRSLSITLVGEWANATTEMQGDYSGVAPFLHSPYYGLQQVPGVNVNLILGIDDSATAVEAAKSSDLIIYVGGISEAVEAEGLDRTTIAWNSTQISFINSISSLGKPVVIAQSGGGQLDDTAFLSSSNISSILWIGYPGQDGGAALADVLFGRVAPAGRLPVSQYPAEYISLPPTDKGLRPDGKLNPGRTYKWYENAVLPFGFGLHYTTFSVTASLDGRQSYNLDDIINRCGNSKHIDLCVYTKVRVVVHNTGNRTSDYSALAFKSGKHGPLPRPIKELVSYERLHNIKAGEKKHALLPITLGSLARWDEDGRYVLYPGCYKIAIDTYPALAELRFTFHGEPKVLEVLPQKKAAY